MEVCLLLDGSLQFLLVEVLAGHRDVAEVQALDLGDLAARRNRPCVLDRPLEVEVADGCVVKHHSPPSAALVSIGMPSILNGVAVNPATIAPWSWKNLAISCIGSLIIMWASS